MILIEAVTVRIVAGRDEVGGTWTSYYQVIDRTQYPDGDHKLSATLHTNSKASLTFGTVASAEDRYQADESVLSGGFRTPREYAQLRLFDHVEGKYRE